MGVSDGVIVVICLSKDVYMLVKGFGKFVGVCYYDMIIGMINVFNKLLLIGLWFEFGSFIVEGDCVVVEFEGNVMISDG